MILQERDKVISSGIKSYGKLFAGFGANVVTGSLDVLEALGKKTFEKLTVSERVCYYFSHTMSGISDNVDKKG